MLTKFKPTSIDALNKHIEQIISPPWDLINNFREADSLTQKVKQMLDEDTFIKAYLLKNYAPETLSLELKRVTLLYNNLASPSDTSNYLVTVIVLVLGSLAYLKALPQGILSLGVGLGSAIIVINFIISQIIINQRMKLRRAILILELCLTSIESSQKREQR